jgi:glycerol uptake facilitator-like aquaporin
MQQRLDAPEMMTRVGEVAKEFRKSDVYPAVVGGIAGGIAGALIAAVIASRGSSPRADSFKPAKDTRGRWSIREVLSLATIVASLARQAQALLKEQEKE